MPYGLKQITPPSGEPITLDEAKQWLRVSIADDDPLIRGLITTARQTIESVRGIQLLTATWQLTADRFPRYSQLGGLQYASEGLWSQRIPQTELAGRYWPDRASFRLPKPPLQAVSQIRYVDGATGNWLILDPSLYIVDTTTPFGRIAPVPGSIWPIIKQQLGSVVITFLAGYGGASDVPANIKTAIKMMVSHLYVNREAVSLGALTLLPMGVDTFLDAEWPLNAQYGM